MYHTIEEINKDAGKGQQNVTQSRYLSNNNQSKPLIKIAIEIRFYKYNPL